MRHFANWMTGYRARSGEPLTPDDRVFLWCTLCLWLGDASSKPVPITLLRFSGWDHVDREVHRYLDSLAAGGDYAGLDDLDLARLLILVELAYGSDLFGAGRRFTATVGIPDLPAIEILRLIQRKVSTHRRAEKLFPSPAAD
jgi:hypothetical protein